jgi:hypothetical protein
LKRKHEHDSGSTVSGMPNALKRPRKKALALPPGADNNNIFHRVFIPTYKQWVGTQADPWVTPDSVAIVAMQTIWDAIYQDVPWTVTRKDDGMFERMCFLVSVSLR